MGAVGATPPEGEGNPAEGGYFASLSMIPVCKLLQIDVFLIVEHNSYHLKSIKLKFDSYLKKKNLKPFF